MVLVSGILPHHHHGSMTCVGIEECFVEKHNCGCESEHHSGSDTDHDEHSCVADAHFLAQKTTDNSNQKDCSCHNLNHLHFFPVHFIVNWLLSPFETEIEKPDYGEYLVTYTSVNVNHAHGLRAPPFFA